MERKYWYWLNNIEGIGNIKIRNLLGYAVNPYNVWQMEREELLKIPAINAKDADRIISKEYRKKVLDKYDYEINHGVKFVFPFEEEYPDNLRELYDKPNILYYKGRLPDKYSKKIAIVGSRNCSEYGRYVARELAKKITSAGGIVISGLASGIDSEAHRGALLAGGTTYAVLAGGVEKCYPPENINLFVDIINQGGIISEYPGESITRPGLFPLRNRIISGMSDAVIVVEAGVKSGSLITAMQALEQNRDVYAVPGRIGDPTGKGCNRLIAEGAMVVTDFDSILLSLNLADKTIENEINNNIPLAKEEKMLYTLLLDFAPRSLESLTVESGLQSEQVIRELINLEIKGFIKEISKNFYIRVQ